MNIGAVAIDYDEPNPATYRAVQVKENHRIIARFASDNPSRDYREALKFAGRHFYVTLNSHSVDSFVLDGGELDVNWLDQRFHDPMIRADTEE
jgi:hypothetical protein